MRRLLTIGALALFGVLSIGLYLLESEVEQTRRQLAALDVQLLEEQKNLQVLKAEWSYLNQPERLQQLAVAYIERFQLQPIAPSQIGRLAALPMRPETEPSSEDGQGGMVGLPRPAFKPAPPPGVVFASSGVRQ